MVFLCFTRALPVFFAAPRAGFEACNSFSGPLMLMEPCTPFIFFLGLWSTVIRFLLTILLSEKVQGAEAPVMANRSGYGPTLANTPRQSAIPTE